MKIKNKYEMFDLMRAYIGGLFMTLLGIIKT